MDDVFAGQISPADLAEAAATGVLHLNGRDLEGLPDSVGKLTGLRELRLDGNRLTSLPPAIGELSNLRTLWLFDNDLEELPPELGRLMSLEDLWLDGNRLTWLPQEIGRLGNLTQLRLIGNELTSLPPEIGQLRRLEILQLDGNQLGQLPTSIGELAALSELSCANNLLTGLPPTVSSLDELRELLLDGNQIAALPLELGQLKRLRVLSLDDNRLTRLPRELAHLLRRSLASLSLQRNPLADPLPQLVSRGPVALASYLEGMVEEVELLEAKVLLVGEGKVGKSSVLAAIQGRPFMPNRPATHAIDVQEMHVQEMHKDDGLLLRFWDFGGQSVYRVSNQFFYSSRALFLLVWNARAAEDSRDVVGWLRRIRARIGEYAQVVLVGTHADAPGAGPLDPSQLPSELAGMVRGSYLLDNCSGKGVPELKRAIIDHAKSLEHLGTRLPAEWAAVRTEVAARAASVPVLSRHDYLSICEQHGVVDADAQETLATLMHDLGQVIYHGHIAGLRDTLVLDPEWLAKAIGAILTDKPTRTAAGVLDHARLPKIWGTRKNAYAPTHHAYLLRLMEEFDISWRLEDGAHSLIAPLVPEHAPALPWTADTPLPEGVRRLQVRCGFVAGAQGSTAERIAPAPGLISALTVRHHHASTNKHWRTGVFLHHPNPQLDSTALIELLQAPGAAIRSDDVAAQLMVEVRGADPAFFFHVLVESVETLRRQCWPGLDLDLRVPCPGRRIDIDRDGSPCTQLFSLADLRRRRANGRTRTECVTCNTEHDTAELLTGFAGVAEGLSPAAAPVDEAAVTTHLEDLAGSITKLAGDLHAMGQDVREIRGGLAMATKGMFHVLLAVNTLVHDVPRLFTIAQLPVSANGWRRHQDSFELMLWCEHPGEYHPVPEATFIVRRPKKWLRRVRPYASMTLAALRPFLPGLVDAVAAGILTSEQLAAVQRHLEVVESLEYAGHEPADDDGPELVSTSGTPQPAFGAALRAFRGLILELAPSRVFPGLDSFPAPSGEIVWVCARHEPIYRRDAVHLAITG